MSVSNELHRLLYAVDECRRRNWPATTGNIRLIDFLAADELIEICGRYEVDRNGRSATDHDWPTLAEARSWPLLVALSEREPAIEACQLSVEEREEDTLIACFHRDLPQSEPVWRMSFRPEDEAAALTRQGFSPDVLGALRVELDEPSWQRFLDQVIPHRSGEFVERSWCFCASFRDALPGLPRELGVRFRSFAGDE